MKTSIVDALGISVLGLAVVFAVLVLLMIIIYIMTAVMRKGGKKALPATPVAAAAVSDPARGSCGTVSVFEVPDRTAAMVMAIVADELDTPLNELRFISIKEAEDGSK